MILRHVICLAAAAAALAAGECRAIEMWTFYGDGSRIGLPSLEVPVEAYPGIPLRSDRIRTRRRGVRAAPVAAPVAAPRGGTAMPGSITLRTMPQAPTAVPVAPDPEALLGPARR